MNQRQTMFKLGWSDEHAFRSKSQQRPDLRVSRSVNGGRPEDGPFEPRRFIAKAQLREVLAIGVVREFWMSRCERGNK